MTDKRHAEALAVLAGLVEALEACLLELHCSPANEKELNEMAPGEFAEGHWCHRCDEDVDRNGELRAWIRNALKRAKDSQAIEKALADRVALLESGADYCAAMQRFDSSRGAAIDLADRDLRLAISNARSDDSGGVS